VVITKTERKTNNANTYLVVHSSLLIHTSEPEATICIRTSAKSIVRAHSLIALIAESKLCENG
jgi:hypothetical protein